MRKTYIVILLAAALVMVFAGTLIATSSTTYKDVPADAWYASYLNLDCLSGYPDGTFRPEQLVTRAELAKIVISAIGETPSTTATASFTDVANTYWAKGYIERAKELGIIGGYGDGSFKPTNYVTRQEAAKIFVLASESIPTAYRGEFSDVSVTLWSAPYIQAAKDLGVISGYPDGTFRPLAQTSRSQAAKMVYVMINGSDAVPTSTTTTTVPTSTTPPVGDSSTIVYITESGTKYHVDGCSYLSKSKIPITLGEAKAQGYGACSKCNPPR